MTKLKRTATVVSDDYSTCSYLNKSDVEEMKFNFPHIAKTLRSKIKELKNENMVFRRLMIKNLFYLRDMSDDIINEIICNLTVQRYAKGSIILKNGDASDKLLFVRHGEVDVKVTNKVS